MIEAVRDRLADGDATTGSTRELGADVGEHLLLAALRAGQIDVDLGVVDALGVLIELGAAGAPAEALHLGNLHDQPLGDGAEAVGLGQRDAGVVLQVDEDGALVERRQERPRQQYGADRRQPARRAAIRREQRARPAERPVQAACVLPALSLRTRKLSPLAVRLRARTRK